MPIGEPPLIRAVAAPYKLAPDDPGGREVADQGEINELLRDEPATGPARARAAAAGGAARADHPRRAGRCRRRSRRAAATAGTPRGEPAPAQGARAPGDATQEAEAALARLLADVGPAAPPAASAG